MVRDLPVLGFDEVPRDADGLLGMDVLDRLSGGLPGTVGKPRKSALKSTTYTVGPADQTR